MPFSGNASPSGPVGRKALCGVRKCPYRKRALSVKTPTLLRAAITLGTLALLYAAPTGQQPQRLALLIGINDYAAVRHLAGAVNDIERTKAVLIGRYEFSEQGITTLTDRQATRAGILKAFDALIAKTRPNDTVIIHYSGHGSRIPDISGDERDGWDETIVPQDSRQPGVFDITDDELNEILGRLTAKTQNVTVILDSCHSGSATRGGADARRVLDDLRIPPPSSPGVRTVEDASDLRPENARYVLISGSRPYELSNEFDVDGKRFGALTYFLTRALSAAKPEATYRDILETVAADVSSEFPSQHPQIEGSADRPVFGVGTSLTSTYVLVNPGGSGSAVTVEGGRLLGIYPGAELDVYAPGTRDFSAPAPVRVRIGAAEALQSTAEFVKGTAVAASSRGVMRSRTYPDAKLRVQLIPATGSAAIEAIRGRLSEFTGVQLVTDERTADIRLRHERNLIFTESADLRQISAPLDATSSALLDAVAMRVTDWLKWFAVLRLENDDAFLPVSLTIGDGSRHNYSVGDIVEVRVTNLSSQNAYLTLLDLEMDGKISSLSKDSDRVEPIPPSGTTPARRIRMTAAGTDVFKALLTTTPIDPALFTQPAARGGDTPVAPSDPLARFIAGSIAGHTRTGQLVESVAWGTDSIRLNTGPAPSSDRPQPAGTSPVSLAGFVAHFAENTRDPGGAAAGALVSCPATGPQPEQCWKMTPMGPASSAVDLQMGGRAGTSRAPLSMGGAWDEAARLRSVTGADFVEPVFEVTLDEQAPEPTARSGSGTPDKDAARADTEWSLKHVRAEAAWLLLRAEQNRPANAEATGVIVAHPDTGYREHPEFWNADPSTSPVMFDKGWNFVEDNARPFDPLIDDGAFPNPGHGTKSGSVIVSPPGKQWTGGAPTDYVSGIAPGARLVPLRVHTSVIHFNPSRLAQAINYAAAPDGQKVRITRPADVISISMGGLPSLALYKAVRAAERKGVLLVAAAGNNVKFVVWPARFKTAIAVAASNVECGTWPGSSRGSAVDVTAPGESVWRAEVNQQGVNGAGMGQGTTFATATTAGVAALWVARHRDNPLFEKLRQQGRLTDVFRDALQKSAWRPGTTGETAPPTGVVCNQSTWDSSHYGAGIVNAESLLKVPLTESPSSRELDDPPYPLFASLFRRDVAADVPARRLQTLFSSASPQVLRLLDAELTNLYALDVQVQTATDAITTLQEPPAGGYAALREVLNQKDISTVMADALRRR